MRVPASPAQWKFWKVHELKPATNADNMIVTIPLMNQIYISTLGQAIRILTQRHEVLRTAFEVNGGLLVQAISPEVEVNVRQVDVAGNPDKFQASVATAESLRRTMDDPFDFATAPLFRATLITFSESSTQCALITTSHAIVDGWSINIIRRELRQLLAAPSGGGHGKSSQWQPVKQFRHVMEERNHERSIRISRQWDYWMRQLSGISPSLSIPLLRSREDIYRETLRDEPVKSIEGSQASLKVRSARVSRTTLHIAALASALSKYSTNGEVVIGNIYSNRAAPENRDVVGLLFNVLPLRISVKGNPSAQDLIQQVNATALRSYVNGEVQMEDVAKVLGFGQAVFGGGPPLWEAAVNVTPAWSGHSLLEKRIQKFQHWLWSIRGVPLMERWDGRIMEVIDMISPGETASVLRYNSEILNASRSRAIAHEICNFFAELPDF
jgi:hypothetical protein